MRAGLKGRITQALLFVPAIAFSWLALALDNSGIAPAELAQHLKLGGYLLYFRHATTDHRKDDSHPVDLQNCATQRNLSQEGRREAKLIGEHIKRIAIPIGEVVSSPYCRCRDTAQLMFGRHRVEEELTFAITTGPEERRQITQTLQSMLAELPPPGMNRVVVSHTANLREATGIWPKPEGVAWVFQADGDGGFKALGMIAPAEWEGLQ